MPVTWDRGSEDSSPLVADRNLYLDASNNKVVEEGDAASATQFVAAGHPIDKADADRLGLVEKGGKIVQDRAVKIEAHQKLVDDLQGEKDAMAESIKKYQADHSTKDIPNTMEKARVDLETRYEAAKWSLAQFIKAGRGMDPTVGESQATALKPEKSPTAKEATKRANAAVRAAPTPRELAQNAPTKPSESPNPTEAAPKDAVARKAVSKSAPRSKGKGK